MLLQVVGPVMTAREASQKAEGKAEAQQGKPLPAMQASRASAASCPASCTSDPASCSCPGKDSGNGLSAWATFIHVEDPDEVSGSCFQHSPAL